MTGGRTAGVLPALVLLGGGLVLLVATVGAQVAPTPPASAKVDTEAIELTLPDRYQLPGVLEPIRRVTLVAAADGVLRSQDARVGASVREGQEVAKLDSSEAAARLRIARAEVREHKADVDSQAGAATIAAEIAQARLDAAQARVELAQLDFDRCILRAPFAGKVVAAPLADGQYVARGTVIAEVADTTSLRALIPVVRAGLAAGATVPVTVEGQAVTAKVAAVVPLPESCDVLRELASPYAGAWVVLANPAGTLDSGQRVLSPSLPNAPIATIPAQALRKPDPKDKDPEGMAVVQVIRNDYVREVKVRVLGNPTPDRAQVTGPFRPTDALIAATNVPLVAGTLIQFHGNTAEADGAEAPATPPRTGSRTAPAPIGAPGSALPGRGKPANRPPATTTKPDSKAGGSVPF